jgi:hypothetical protein
VREASVACPATGWSFDDDSLQQLEEKKMQLRRRLQLLLLVCACTLVASPARAELRVVFGYTSAYTPAVLELNDGAVQITAKAEGWFDHFGNQENNEGNYIAGVCGLPYNYCSNVSDVVYRDFFVFDLASLQSNVASASLLLWNPEKTDYYNDNGYMSSHDTETFLLHEVHTSTTELTQINSHRVDVFDDLGTGTFYGERVMSAADSGTWVRVPLNAAGLAALYGAAGGTIALGGSLANVGAVPEPQTFALMLGGLGLAAWRVRRSRSQTA